MSQDVVTGTAEIQALQTQLAQGPSPFQGAVLDLGLDDVFATPTEIASGDFAQAEAAARGLRDLGLVHNFQKISLNRLPMTWDDEAAFAVIVRNLEMAARSAAAAGMRGLWLENQMYGRSVFAVATDRSFDSDEALVLKRGSEMAAALVRGFPGAELILLWGYSEMWREVCIMGRPLPSHPYALYPAFLDGLRQGLANGQTRLIDGYLPAYPARAAAPFQMFRSLVHADHNQLERAWQPDVVTHWDGLGAGGPLLWPARYAVTCDAATSMRLSVPLPASFGLMIDYDMDAFMNPVPATVPRPTTADLPRGIAAALRSTDAYVWLYAGASSWWPAASRPQVPDSVSKAVLDAQAQVALDPVGWPQK
ncbi:MAG: hypothetical protein SF187_09625 [Deltaproteobacteria bacterium]|nr:hypothetical protein [Deltaproteobacteria bacterium]